MQTWLLMFPEFLTKENLGEKKKNNQKTHPTSQTLPLHKTDFGWIMATQQQQNRKL